MSDLVIRVVGDVAAAYAEDEDAALTTTLSSEPATAMGMCRTGWDADVIVRGWVYSANPWAEIDSL